MHPLVTTTIESGSTQATIARLSVFPLKSFDGLSLTAATVLPSGPLAHDRRWALVNRQGTFVNGKKNARLHAIRTTWQLLADGQTLAGEFVDTITGETLSVTLPEQAASLSEYLSAVLGVACELRENAAAGFPDDTEAPGPTVISNATLAAVSARFTGLSIDEVRRRFRANIEVAGVPAFWEDSLYREPGAMCGIRLGDVSWLATNPCQRCVVPTRDSQTGAVWPEFAKQLATFREESLPNWVTGSRFNHFYRLAVNTRLHARGCGAISVGQVVEPW